MANREVEDQAKEQQFWAEKYFNIAEAPICKWLAFYTGENVTTLYKNYREQYEKLLVKGVDGITYCFYVDCDGEDGAIPNNNFELCSNDLDTNDNFCKAISLIYDSVYSTFIPICRSMECENDIKESSLPRFIEAEMKFGIQPINKVKVEKMKSYDIIMKLVEQHERLKSAPDCEQKTEVQAKIDTAKNEEIIKFNAITQELIDEEEERMKSHVRNAEVFLYIHCHKVEDEDLYEKLPSIGAQFSDPTEEEDLDVNKIVDEFNDLEV
jgi:hypothetical protein